jgi:hypothetical protein
MALPRSQPFIRICMSAVFVTKPREIPASKTSVSKTRVDLCYACPKLVWVKQQAFFNAKCGESHCLFPPESGSPHPKNTNPDSNSSNQNVNSACTSLSDSLAHAAVV